MSKLIKISLLVSSCLLVGVIVFVMQKPRNTVESKGETSLSNVHISTTGQYNSQLKVSYSYNGQQKEYVGNIYDCDAVIDSDEYVKKIDFNKDGEDELFIACGKGASSLGYHVLSVDKEGDLIPMLLGDAKTISSDGGYELKDINGDSLMDIQLMDKNYLTREISSSNATQLIFDQKNNSFVKN